MLNKNQKKKPEKSLSYDDDYPDDFESYTESASSSSSNEESLELIDLKNPKKPENPKTIKHLDELSSKIDLEFEMELDYLLQKQENSKKIKKQSNYENNLNFRTPVLGRRATENIDEWIEKQTQELKLSSESHRTIAYSYAKSLRRDREESPSTEFSYNPNKRFNCNNPRPTLCGNDNFFHLFFYFTLK